MDLKVLLVDDDKMVLFLHKILVESSKLPSVPCSFMNGKEVLEFLTANENENLHYLIMLDINMPEMNGWEFLENIQEKSIKERISVCIVTSSINVEDRQKAGNYKQVIDYVEKPLSMEICNAIGEKLKKKPKNA